MDIITIVVLALSGLLLTFVGLMRLTNPIKTYSKNSGIELDQNTDLLNEIRGVSALMLTGGILILSGILVEKLTLISHVVACLILIGFAIGRIFSMMTDGKPNTKIVQGLIFEIVFGLANVACIVLMLK